MNALEYINSREKVVVCFVSQGAPTGWSIAYFPHETELPFDLAKVEGEVREEDGAFSATNLVCGLGLHEWRFRDWKGNYITAIYIYQDVEEWDRQFEELM